MNLSGPTRSDLCEMFESGNIARGWLPGHCANPLIKKRYLLTPVLNPTNPHQDVYDKAYIQTRNPIERAFIVLKMRFPCTDHSGGKLLFRPERACRIVTTCVVLHITIQRSSTGKASIEMKFAYPLSLLYIESIHCDVECFDSYGRKPRMMYISNLASNVLWFYTAKRYLMMSDL